MTDSQELLLVRSALREEEEEERRRRETQGRLLYTPEDPRHWAPGTGSPPALLHSAHSPLPRVKRRVHGLAMVGSGFTARRDAASRTETARQPSWQARSGDRLRALAPGPGGGNKLPMGDASRGPSQDVQRCAHHPLSAHWAAERSQRRLLDGSCRSHTALGQIASHGRKQLNCLSRRERQTACREPLQTWSFSGTTILRTSPHS